MIKKIPLLLFLATLKVGFLWAQQFDWVQKIAIKRADADPGLPAWTMDPIIETDPYGNIFVASSFKDTLTFGTTSIVSKGGFDSFIARYNADGSVKWIKQLEGLHDQHVTDMDVDRDGNIYLTGIFSEDLKIGGNIVTGSGAYIIRLTNDGTLSLLNKIEGEQKVFPIRILAAEYYSGEIILAGSLNGTVDFGCSTLTADQQGTKFVARFNLNGTCEWANKFVASYLTGMAFDGYNIYMTGGFLGNAVFGEKTLTADFQDIYIAKCGIWGEWGWAFGIGGAGEDQARDVEVDNSGNIIITGFFEGTVDFGTEVVTSTGANDIFVASFDPYESLNWVRQAGGGSGNQYAFDIDVSASDKLIITGSIIDETHFGANTLNPTGEKSFFAVYDNQGTCLRALGTTGSSGDRGVDIATIHTNTYLAGTFFSSGEYVFGQQAVQADVGEIYISKITNPSQRFTWIIPQNPVNVQYSHNAWVDFDGDNDLDFLVTGANSTNDLRTVLYENIGSDRFRPAMQPFNSLPQYSESEIAFLNLNHDDRIDFMFMGRRIGFGNTNRISLIENTENGFTDRGPLPDFGNPDGYGTISVGDVNKDGFEDIFVSGITGIDGGEAVLGAFIYLNEGGTFTKTLSDVFTGLYIAASRLADLDNDQDLDLIVCGRHGEYPYQKTFIYINDGTGIFSLSPVQLTRLQNPSIDVYDMDGDNDVDILLTGLNEMLDPVTRLYRNISGAFEEISLPASMNRTASGSAKWGDYDNDGDADILMTGNVGTLSVFLNDGGTFTELLDPAFEGLGIGYASWGDYDDDGDLDILATGISHFDNEAVPTLYILRNEMTTKNEAPAAPEDFTVTPIDDQSVVLHWGAPGDDITPSASLTYNISIRDLNAEEYLLHPFSEMVTGKRMIAEQGNITLNNGWSLSGLEPGTYSIQVQAIDGGYRGSPWTTEEIFFAGPILPPDGLTAHYDGGQVHLSWSDNSVNEQYFIVERKYNDGEFAKYDSVSFNVPDLAVPAEDVGAYSYRVYAANPAEKSSYSNTADIIITGVETIAENLVDLYPNPAVNSVFVAINEMAPGSASLQIRDSRGVVVVSEQIIAGNVGETQIDISLLSPGIYLVQLNTARTSRSVRLVKK